MGVRNRELPLRNPPSHTDITPVSVPTFMYGRQTDVMVEELAELHQDHGVARVGVADVTVHAGGDAPRGGQRLTGH